MMNAIRPRLYQAVRSSLGQRQRTALKRWMARSRKTYPSIYVWRYGHFSTDDLIGKVSEMIDEEFDVLMVHSAYESLLPMYRGTPQVFVNALLEFCGAERTLAMPTFVLGAPDYNPIEYYRRVRTFDVRRSISEMGLPTELFRRKPGVKRSLHPTHSVAAVGPLAEELTANHHLGTTRLGKHSPFEVMAQKRTVIIGIGVEYFRSLTQAKSVEDILGDAFPLPSVSESVDVQMIDKHGREQTYALRIRKFQPGTVRGDILRSLMSATELLETRFHGIPLWKTNARCVTERLLEAAATGVTHYGRAGTGGKLSSGEDIPANLAGGGFELGHGSRRSITRGGSAQE